MYTRVATVLLLALATTEVSAECGGEGPRLGLVLSGGGARGLAHVGVLEVLEEEGIAVDCVAGTSMGAAIGSLWAAGYSAGQIEEIVHSIDWQEVFSGRRVRALVPLSRRIDDVPPALRLRVDGLRPRLPPARDSDYRLNRLLFRLLAPASLRAAGDFDRLPVPFRTVTTDLETVQPVVLSRGSLPRAVRASMSPPVTVPTIETNGRVLVDGGIVDNVPVNVARGMGADVVLAVDVTSPPLRREEWSDILGAGRQLIDALMREHAKRWEAEADLVLTPDLEGRGAEDFSDPEALIDAGRDAARAALPRIRALAGTGTPRVAAALAPPPLVAEVVVRGARRVQDHAVLAALGFEPPAPLDFPRVLRGFDRVWATGLYDTLWIDLEPMDGGQARLVVEVRESVPSALEIGWAYDEADEVNAFARFRHRNLFGHGERFDVTLLGGARDSGARVMLLGNAPWVSAVGYLAGGQLVEERPVVYRAGQEVARASFSRDVVFGGVQASFGPDMLLQGRIDLGRVKVDARQGLGPGREDDYRMLRGLFAWDRLDDPDLPESGAALTFRAERSLTGGEDVRDYWRGRADGRAAWARAGFVLDGAALVALSGRDVPEYDLHRIGGPRFLPGRPREERWARQAVGVAASLGRDVFGFRVSLEGGAGGAFDRRQDIALRDLGWGVGVGIARRTRLGPVILQAGLDEDGAGAVYLSVGRR